MIETFVALLLALLVRDVVRWYAAKLDWRWSVNRSFAFRGVPLRVQLVRALAGKTPQYGRG